VWLGEGLPRRCGCGLEGKGGQKLREQEDERKRERSVNKIFEKNINSPVVRH